MQRDRWSAVRKLTVATPDGRRFIKDPPLLIPLGEGSAWGEALQGSIMEYRTSLSADRQVLLDRYQVIDLGPQGGWGRQRGASLLRPAHAGSRRGRPAGPAGEAGGRQRAGAVHRAGARATTPR
ncbi:MAG: DUF2252 family protein [Actinomycetales bacterium]